MNIDKMSLQDLLLLNKQICARVRQLQTIRAVQAQAQFTIGQRVAFTSKTGATITGTIRAMGPKNIQLTTDAGTRWRVAPTLLRAA